MAENTEGRRSTTATLSVWAEGDICGCVSPSEEGEGGRVRRGRERVRRITEGQLVTSPEAFPWQVLMEIKYHSDRLCGGTLLRPDWFLTAAHCLHAGNHWLNTNELTIRVGVVNRSASEPTQQYLEVYTRAISDVCIFLLHCKLWLTPFSLPCYGI